MLPKVTDDLIKAHGEVDYLAVRKIMKIDNPDLLSFIEYLPIYLIRENRPLRPDMFLSFALTIYALLDTADRLNQREPAD